MNLFNPNTAHTSNIYEKGRYVLIWNLSIIASVIFTFTSILLFSFDSIIFALYLLMFFTSVFSLYYLKKYKKVKPIFWLYTIMASAILIGSFHTLHHVLHYKDILWTICVLLFAFIGLEYKNSIVVASIHALSLVLFTFFSLNTNIETVSVLPMNQLLVFSIETMCAFIVIIILSHHFLKYQKFTQVELSKTRRKYKNVIENINEALIQDDKDGTIIFWNTKFLEMFHYHESEMTDMKITKIINKEYHDLFKSRHNQRMNGDRNIEQLEYQGKTKNGDSIWLDINVTPLLENGKIIGTQSLIHDVTDRKEQEIQLLRINQELIKIEEAERERIAYEIHDGLSQTLVAARIYTELGASKEKLLEIIDGALSESKTITQNLVPKDIIEYGLIYAVKSLIKRISDSGNLNIKFTCNCESDFYEHTEYIQFNIYRIVQECLTNTLKHARANEVNIAINSFKDCFTMEFTNDGDVIPENRLNTHNFLIAIKRRVNILNGKFNITHNKNGKVAFLISIPYDFEGNMMKKAI